MHMDAIAASATRRHHFILGTDIATRIPKGINSAIFADASTNL
jgi:hypothetical protein